MSQRPGVILYFDIRKPLKRMSLEEKGRLLDAILDYAELGIEPELEGSCGMAWDFIQPKIDRDGENYTNTCSQRKYAAYVRWAQEKGEKVLDYSSWKEHRADAGASDRIEPQCERIRTMPTTTQLQPNQNTTRKVTGDSLKGPELLQPSFEQLKQEGMTKLAQYRGEHDEP